MSRAPIRVSGWERCENEDIRNSNAFRDVLSVGFARSDGAKNSVVI